MENPTKDHETGENQGTAPEGFTVVVADQPSPTAPSNDDPHGEYLVLDDEALRVQAAALVEAAVDLVVAEARRLMALDESLVRFLMGNGLSVFEKADGTCLHAGDDAATKPLNDFLCEWDHVLHLDTSCAVTVTKTEVMR